MRLPAFVIGEMLNLNWVAKKLLQNLAECNFFATFAVSLRQRVLYFISFQLCMKTSEFKRLLLKKGCRLQRHGSRHDMWLNPDNGHTAMVPRHDAQEVSTGLRKKIMMQLFGTD